MSTPMRATCPVDVGEDPRNVYHCRRGVDDKMLDALAAARVPIRANCGFTRIPRRPPFAPPVVTCPACLAVCRGEREPAA